MKILRGVAAGLGAGMTSWFLPAAILIYQTITDTGFDKFGEVDNAPRRAGFALLMLSPVFICLAGTTIFLPASLLKFFRHYSRARFVGGSNAAGGLVSMSLGAWAWWRLTPREPNEV